MRHVKKVNPEKRCFLQYDKLYIDGKVFMFNETSGKVVDSKKSLWFKHPGREKSLSVFEALTNSFAKVEEQVKRGLERAETVANMGDENGLR